MQRRPLRPLLRVLFVALLFAPAARASTDGPALGRHAPDHGLAIFVGSENKERKVVKRSDGVRQSREGSREPIDLSGLRGKVVLIHASPWRDRDGTAASVQLVAELLCANEDRDIAAIGISAGEPSEELSKRAEALGIDWPVALVGGEGASTVYYSPESLGEETLFLVGRSGELAWRGDPVAEESALLEAVDAALRAVAAPPIGRELNAELADAQASYYAGDWVEARSLARKLEKKHGGEEDAASTAIVEDAKLLAELVDRHEHDIVVRASEAVGKHRYVEFLTIQEAVDRGFERTDAPKEIKELGKAAVKGMSGTMFDDAQRWMELAEDRPVLFPVRQSSQGDRYAKKLEKFVKASPNDFGEKQWARKMLEEYAAVW